MLEVRPLGQADAGWKRQTLIDAWGSTIVARLGEGIDAMALDGFVALIETTRHGLLTFRIVGAALEIVTVQSDVPGRGIGRALMDAARDRGRGLGVRRLWLTTTNDNVRAIEFYQRWGMDLARLHRDGVAASRAVKPDIPATASNGIPIRHELEFELVLSQ